MAYQRPTDIDGFVAMMAKADMRVKAQLAEDLVAYLSDQENSIVSNDLGLLIDGLMPWLTGSHYKVKHFYTFTFTSHSHVRYIRSFFDGFSILNTIFTRL